jgi:hypothetical protein
MKSRIYTYKVTFEEVPYWYWGVHREKKFNDGYLGTPSTHRWMWEFYTPHLQILEIFPNTEKGWKEAQLVEKRLIRPDLNNPLCLNEGCGSYLSRDSLVRGARVVHRLRKGSTHTEKAKENLRAGHNNPETKEKHRQATLEVMSRPEVKASIKRKARGRWEKRKEELSASMRGVKIGYHWWVNRKGETRCCSESPGNDWQSGRKWRP